MRAACLVLLAACGDNTSLGFGLDAAYDDHAHSRFFGTAQSYNTPKKIANLDGAQVCIADSCVTTANGGQFVLIGTGPQVEATIVITAAGLLPTIIPVTGGVAGDRNLGTIPVVSPALQAQTAAAFGVDPMTDSHGTLLVNVARYDMGAMQLAIDGLHTYYLGPTGDPAPSATQLSASNDGVWYGLPPEAESVVYASAGHCDAGEGGWPGAVSGQVRVPAMAGAITFASIFCYGP